MPQRMSALYQYHNAPEVAPAHGLEYDDNVYPSSDKYPVVRETGAYDRIDRRGFADNNKPPRIIFGMKIKTFLVVALIMILIVVGAAVGGAVGGKQLREDHSQLYNGTFATATPAASPTATFTAATPTYTPLSDCPESNDTGYTSSFDKLTDQPDAGLKFTKLCDLASPISDSQRIAEAYVYSFSDCVEVCASYNYWSNSRNCTVAVYLPDGKRPGNCWTGQVNDVQASSLNSTIGTNVALLDA
ncbi:uncharacterized protein RCC_06460 [Ramularia collo-cygni]|uniref:Apple domain-containing protein n=1 Tax=Ramularia collo-cygni TaxID=112498 RepID=A0A2D3UT37_9PEZI|nr:uncharacterized protein RCC_06460 [Ramularia collo-cygni]CZT20602.1 uncharacterized protein RCC_06460 [Ramularia collo-cygni]